MYIVFKAFLQSNCLRLIELEKGKHEKESKLQDSHVSISQFKVIRILSVESSESLNTGQALVQRHPR